jgi:hypothetical protein
MIRLAIVLTLALSPSALAQTIIGTATLMGTALRSRAQMSVCLGIDAPEYMQTCQVNYSAWACEGDAASALRTLIDNHPITCILREKDVYGRTVANCLIDGQDVAAQVVAQGFATVLANGQSDYAAIEAHANASKAGIWASKFDMPVYWCRAHPREPHAALGNFLTVECGPFAASRLWLHVPQLRSGTGGGRGADVSRPTAAPRG